ncbi:hypothetical protein COCCADRAFT_83631 [Bipolaris zeicola 26-R-13]|uniref:Uncharacterized protein n=1 Tax=Cochliobolus carbonum (strain 26-R-13) TaxID=930089 RepID=W6YKN2_COCC2|nr:uncharacterized protein COCCADRAFT_83631 [Bipolaris zeicola 26-R-13]EUC38275.1 hypothetical protein COCCADRAFT_83631 [Bipolaris zeicola 26-R-13]
MSFAAQPHTSHSRSSFSAPRSDAQTRERWGSRPWKHRETMGMISTEIDFRVDEESLPLDVLWEDPLLSIPSPGLEWETALEGFMDTRRAIEDFDYKAIESSANTMNSVLRGYANCRKCAEYFYYLRGNSFFSARRVFAILFIYPADNTEFFWDFDTIDDPVECKIWKRLVEPNPGSYQRQQQAPQEKRPHPKPRHRNKVEKEPFRAAKVLMRDDTILEIVDKLEQTLSSLQIDTKVEWRMAHRRSSLKNWRRAAGKSKSWKPCLKSTVPKQTHLNRRRQNSNGVAYHSAKPPPWLPATFLRSQTIEMSLCPGYVLRRQETDSVPRRARCHDHYTHDFEDTPIAPHGKHHTKAAQSVNTWESKSGIIEDMNKEPAGAFIRFTWKDGTLTNGTGQLDRFLSTDSIPHSHWNITGFLRNESFADVYSLSEPPFGLPSVEIGVSLEAHVFLDEYHGNCAVYASRSKNRMRQSGNCLDTFWHNGRHIFVMKIPKKPVLFKLHNTEEEFPSLVNQDKCNEKIALQRRRFRGRPSFAAMAGSGWPDASSECQSVLMNEGQSALEKELERIEKARVKKAERQRVKRRSQREKRLGEKQ